MKVLITGADGFFGKNLAVGLARVDGLDVLKYDLASTEDELDNALSISDVIFHLAGVNRPKDPADFQKVNSGLTGEICDKLIKTGRAPKIVLASSIQAELDNPYGASKLAAERAIKVYAEKTGAAGVIYRLKNLFGKWCRPNYNSVTATFCYNIAHGLPIQISDPTNEVDLTYIDDVVDAFVRELKAGSDEKGFRMAEPLLSYKVTLKELSEQISFFQKHRQTYHLPDFSSPFVRALYATYLTYLEPQEFTYSLDIKSDNRGSLAEFIKTPYMGQIFVSRTKPGVTRGNHYHSTKTEKFFVVEGQAVIRLRNIRDDSLIEFEVKGSDYKPVDIPPGYTHSIENIGESELITLFWSSEVFNPEKPDTTFLPVRSEK
jgi:UDP-2-acetamido-2,6-beta-L-arabino-hexul-4-ose reductase